MERKIVMTSEQRTAARTSRLWTLRDGARPSASVGRKHETHPSWMDRMVAEEHVVPKKNRQTQSCRQLFADRDPQSRVDRESSRQTLSTKLLDTSKDHTPLELVQELTRIHSQDQADELGRKPSVSIAFKKRAYQ